MKNIKKILDFVFGYKIAWLLMVIGGIGIMAGFHSLIIIGILGFAFMIVNIFSTIEKIDTMMKNQHIILVDKEFIKENDK